MNLRDHKHRAMLKHGAHRRFYGKRCSEYAPGCPTCDYWRFYDENGRFPRLEQEGEELYQWQIAKGLVTPA